MDLKGSVWAVKAELVLKASLRWLTGLGRALYHLPLAARVMWAYDAAAEHARAGDFLLAERRLLRAYERLPQRANGAFFPLHLLLAFVSLRLGNPQVAIELIPPWVNKYSGGLYANNAEVAYLRYSAKTIYEEAARQAGEPAALDVGLLFEDVDMSRVRDMLSDTFPILRTPASQIRAAIH